MSDESEKLENERIQAKLEASRPLHMALVAVLRAWDPLIGMESVDATVFAVAARALTRYPAEGRAKILQDIAAGAEMVIAQEPCPRLADIPTMGNA